MISSKYKAKVDRIDETDASTTIFRNFNVLLTIMNRKLDNLISIT